MKAAGLACIGGRQAGQSGLLALMALRSIQTPGVNLAVQLRYLRFPLSLRASCKRQCTCSSTTRLIQSQIPVAMEAGSNLHCLKEVISSCAFCNVALEESNGAHKKHALPVSKLEQRQLARSLSLPRALPAMASVPRKFAGLGSWQQICFPVQCLVLESGKWRQRGSV